MQLDERLKAVAEFIPSGSTTADIGTDHAYLATALAEKGAVKVIAADLNSGPCESARHTVRDNGWEDKIEVRQGNGLSVLSVGEVENVCIAGMGGELISAILGAKPDITEKLNRLVLQPMNDTASVRRWLYQNGWRIIDETLAKESGRLYEIICAEHGTGKIPEGIMLEIGEKIWEKKPLLLKEHIEERLRKKEKVLTGMSKSKEARNSDRYNELLREKAEIEELIKCLNVR